MMKENFYFGVIDYICFGGMLLLSALTGVYFGCNIKWLRREPNDGSIKDYLHGNRQMLHFPVGMSLIASYVSGVTVLGTPAEIYNYGSQYTMIIFSISLSMVVVAYVYVPVFFKLQVTSSYEYLELRFHHSIRTLASCFFILDEILFLPIVIFVPSLAFNQVTGINLFIVGAIVTCTCIFYTVLGGLKAVVWTDTWQIITMFVSTVVILVCGLVFGGGFSTIWERCDEGNRIDFFNFTPSFYERQSFMAVVFGGTTYWTSFNSVNQTMVQRYLSVPTLRSSRIAILTFAIGATAYVLMCCYVGLIIYSVYKECDPLTAGRITHGDQLLPLFVMEIVGFLKGVPGLFIAGVFGASLSSLSVILNSLATVILEDIVRGCFNKQPNDKQATILAKIVCFSFGCSSLGGLFVVQHLGGILGVASSLSSIAAGATFGVFTLGMLMPFANTKGAFAGGIAGLVMGSWVSFGSQAAFASGAIKPHILPSSIAECESLYNITVNYTTPVYPDESGVFPLYRLSYHWITPVGVSSVLIVGAIVSLATKGTDLKTLNPDLIAPCSQWMLPHRRRVPTEET